MFQRHNKIAIGLALTLLQHPAWAQDNANKVLIEQGNYWQERNNSERAAEAWNKLLVLRPNDPHALYGLAQVELSKKRIDAARSYLQRLKTAHPENTLIGRLEQAIALSTDGSKESLEQGRQLAATGKLDQALVQYKKILDGSTPVGDIGREYYTNLGYTSSGLQEAIAGLRRLAQETPGDYRITLALARHLVRQEGTRIEGIRKLAQLSAIPKARAEATKSWREALIWLGSPKPAERPLIEQFLQSHPGDTEIRDNLRKAAPARDAASKKGASRSNDPEKNADPLQLQTDRALVVLKKGNLEQAERDFQSVLTTRPNDSDALGGLGVVRMRQGKWPEARNLLLRARKSNPAWQESLNTAEYWSAMNQADQLRQSGNLSQARKVLVEAAKRMPGNSATEVMLAEMLLDEGHYGEANAVFRGILKRAPRDPGALRGLALSARSTGDIASARNFLEDALSNDPGDPWVRLELAQLYQDAGQLREARGLVDGLLMSDPNNIQALYASAVLASRNGQWNIASHALDRVPPAQRTADMATLHTSVQRKLKIDQAVDAGRQGRKSEALSVLRQLEISAGNDLDTIAAIARAYAVLDEKGRALSLLRSLLQQGHGSRSDVAIAYVGLLLESGQDVEAATLMRQLDQQALSPSQRQALDDASNSYRIRQADGLRERGDLVGAYDVLAPVLQKKPNDKGAIGALARMYVAAGDGTQALGLYEKLLYSDPDDPRLHMSMAQIAQQLKQHSNAIRSVEIALSLAPVDAEILSGAARIYRAQGKTTKAATLIKEALSIQGQQQVATVGSSKPQSLNPFVGLPNQLMVSSLDQTGSSNWSTSPTPVLDHAATPPAIRHPSSTTSTLIALPATVSTQQPNFSVVQETSANPFMSTSVARSRSVSPLALELEQIYQERSPEVKAGPQIRTRTGDGGTSRLSEAQFPVEVRFPVGNDKAMLRIAPVALSSDSLGNNPYALGTFGGGPQALLRNGNEPTIDRPKGIALSLAYETQEVKLDAGVTPLGFQSQSFTGGALFEGAMDDAGTAAYRLDVSSRPVKDSVLSFAGVTDERTGQKWGGVSATGARLTLSKENGAAGLYGSAALHALRGENVKPNQRAEFNTGMYYKIKDEPDTRFIAGVNLNATFFSKNLGHFTYGHGGYFSPKNYYSLNLPVTWGQQQERFSYRLDGSIGVQHFRQADAPLFPTDAGLQSQAITALAQLDLPELQDVRNGMYRGESKTGVGYNLNAAAEYRFTPQMVLGAALAADNANNYREWMGGLYLRYYFHPQNGLLDLEAPYRAASDNTYGR